MHAVLQRGMLVLRADMPPIPGASGVSGTFTPRAVGAAAAASQARTTAGGCSPVSICFSAIDSILVDLSYDRIENAMKTLKKTHSAVFSQPASRQRLFSTTACFKKQLADEDLIDCLFVLDLISRVVCRAWPREAAECEVRRSAFCDRDASVLSRVEWCTYTCKRESWSPMYRADGTNADGSERISILLDAADAEAASKSVLSALPPNPATKAAKAIFAACAVVRSAKVVAKYPQVPEISWEDKRKIMWDKFRDASRKVEGALLAIGSALNRAVQIGSIEGTMPQQRAVCSIGQYAMYGIMDKARALEIELEFDPYNVREGEDPTAWANSLLISASNAHHAAACFKRFMQTMNRSEEDLRQKARDAERLRSESESAAAAAAAAACSGDRSSQAICREKQQQQQQQQQKKKKKKSRAGREESPGRGDPFPLSPRARAATSAAVALGKVDGSRTKGVDGDGAPMHRRRSSTRRDGPARAKESLGPTVAVSSVDGPRKSRTFFKLLIPRSSPPPVEQQQGPTAPISPKASASPTLAAAATSPATAVAAAATPGGQKSPDVTGATSPESAAAAGGASPLPFPATSGPQRQKQKQQPRSKLRAQTEVLERASLDHVKLRRAEDSPYSASLSASSSFTSDRQQQQHQKQRKKQKDKTAKQTVRRLTWKGGGIDGGAGRRCETLEFVQSEPSIRGVDAGFIDAITRMAKDAIESGDRRMELLTVAAAFMCGRYESVEYDREMAYVVEKFADIAVALRGMYEDAVEIGAAGQRLDAMVDQMVVLWRELAANVDRIVEESILGRAKEAVRFDSKAASSAAKALSQVPKTFVRVAFQLSLMDKLNCCNEVMIGCDDRGAQRKRTYFACMLGEPAAIIGIGRISSCAKLLAIQEFFRGVHSAPESSPSAAGSSSSEALEALERRRREDEIAEWIETSEMQRTRDACEAILSSSRSESSASAAALASVSAPHSSSSSAAAATAARSLAASASAAESSVNSANSRSCAAASTAAATAATPAAAAVACPIAPRSEPISGTSYGLMAFTKEERLLQTESLNTRRRRQQHQHQHQHQQQQRGDCSWRAPESVNSEPLAAAAPSAVFGSSLGGHRRAYKIDDFDCIRRDELGRKEHACDDDDDAYDDYYYYYYYYDDDGDCDYDCEANGKGECVVFGFEDATEGYAGGGGYYDGDEYICDVREPWREMRQQALAEAAAAATAAAAASTPAGCKFPTAAAPASSQYGLLSSHRTGSSSSMLSAQSSRSAAAASKIATESAARSIAGSGGTPTRQDCEYDRGVVTSVAPTLVEAYSRGRPDVRDRDGGGAPEATTAAKKRPPSFVQACAEGSGRKRRSSSLSPIRRYSRDAADLEAHSGDCWCGADENAPYPEQDSSSDAFGLRRVRLFSDGLGRDDDDEESGLDGSERYYHCDSSDDRDAASAARGRGRPSALPLQSRAPAAAPRPPSQIPTAALLSRGRGGCGGSGGDGERRGSGSDSCSPKLPRSIPPDRTIRRFS
jgi:hypothetical protein